MTDAKPLSREEREQIAECLSVETVLPDYFGALTEIARIKGLLGKAMRSEAYWKARLGALVDPLVLHGACYLCGAHLILTQTHKPDCAWEQAQVEEGP